MIFLFFDVLTGAAPKPPTSKTYMAVLLNSTISFFLEMTGLASMPSAGSAGGKGMTGYMTIILF